MEYERKTKSFTKNHIAKLHERIQNKYEEMQRRLEKSKSIDLLPSLDNRYDFKNEKKFDSFSDLSFVNQFNNNVNTTQSNSYNEIIVVQDEEKNATSKEIVYKKATVVGSNYTPSLCDSKYGSECEDEREYDFFHTEFFKTSLESLNEVSKGSDDSSGPITPTSKSIRDRIESKLKKRQIEGKEKKKKNKRQDSIEVDKYILSNTSKYQVVKGYKKNKIATVTIVLIEVTGLEEVVDDKLQALLFKFRLGTEKYKSKLAKSFSAKVKFQELFNLHLFEDENILEITLWDKDNLIGRTTVDLLPLEKEKTHKMLLSLDGEYTNVKTFFLLTISGTTLLSTIYNMDEHELERNEIIMKNKYAWYRVFDEFKNVGALTIIVYGAKGLSGQDCYCVVNLNNARIQTQTDYKTNNPSWMKIFSVMVTDITSILEVTVYDEKKCEEVGKVLIPLLSIKPGKQWYSLKDNTLKERAKGNNPRILLEMKMIWNLVKAAVRVINPKEVNYLVTGEKLDRHLFARNLSRAKIVYTWIVNAFTIMKTCFEWESTRSNAIALLIWIVFCLNAKIWMLPLLLVIPFIWYKPVGKEKSRLQLDSKNDKDDKSVSLRQKLNSIQEILLSIQNIIGKFASLGESVKNLYNFTIPFVSCLAIFLIAAVTLVMYLIPFNYICIIWGIHKFTRKLLRPDRIPNNEVLDLLSRVPDHETLIECEELPLGNISEDDS
ncbi:multiple C2 and transmembrane domain-containing protein-like [Melitaea cinxia]|uniref:multiple C2 and transmembrane domain-containing protein-like n=1 Tax=Melitaea cinxia TaxID=113334 RepID=UPI001E272B16|nr:multiple C2 and transmembrane domain-containing protein-like [Melitaea cinxia]